MSLPRHTALRARLEARAETIGWDGAAWDSSLLSAVFETDAGFGRDGYARFASLHERKVREILGRRESA